jgi:SAM-dependent methyltransferase
MDEFEQASAFDGLRRTRHGYYELAVKPTPEALQEYYALTYYQHARGGYEVEYDDAERQYFKNKIAQWYAIVTTFSTASTTRRFLDVGCGEGWALDFFAQQGWDVVGIDFSDFGCRAQNPQMVSRIRTGDIFVEMQAQSDMLDRYDCIWLDNILEHVLDPLALLRLCRRLSTDTGCLVVQVPNDFSTLQVRLLEQGVISRPHWIVEPDHISYFNRDGLVSLCAESGWAAKRIIADYPIEFDLYNTNTNYVNNLGVGKQSHRARIAIENLLHEISPTETNNLYESLAILGLGRGIIAFLHPTD